MKRLHLSLIKSFIGPFILSLIVAIFILLMQFLWKYIDDLVGKGLEITQIFELLFYASARFVPLAIPIAMLISSVMLFGKLAENNELTALKSAGISFYRIIFPITIIAIMISYSSYLFSNYIMPIANLKNASMIYDIQRKKPALNIKEGIFYNDIEGFSLKIGEKDSDGRTLHDIIIYDHTNENGNDKVVIAEKGTMEITKDERFLELILFNGYSYIDIEEKNRKEKDLFRTTHFKENVIRFDLSSFNIMKNSEKLYKGHYAMLSNAQLQNAIDSLTIIFLEKKNYNINSIKEKYITIDTSKIININNIEKINKVEQYNIAISKIKTLKAITTSNKNELNYRQVIITKHKIEWHRKISLAVACFILFLIGASLGSLVKKGGIGIPILISVFFFLIYHILSIIGEKAAKELTIEAYQGIWMTNFIFIPIALFLLYKAKNDKDLFNFNKLKVTTFASK